MIEVKIIYIIIKQIILGHSFLKCKTCSLTVHQRCSGVKSNVKPAKPVKNSKESTFGTFECDVCSNTDKEKVNYLIKLFI